MKLKILAAIAGLMMCSGCGPFWVNPYITVTESKLNWVEIHYYRMDKTPVYRTAVYINGAGYVELRKGTSDQVSNDFAKRYTDKEWGKIKRQRVQVDPAHVNEIFQNLVNHGLLDNEKNFKGAKSVRKDRVLGVKANINNYSYSEQDNIFEVDPDLAEQLLDVVREFDNPTL